MTRKILAGKASLVIGGSGGIGQVVAAQLATQGCAVCIAGRSRRNVSAALDMLHEAGHGEIKGLCCNIEDHAAVRRMIRQAVKLLGGLDILVNAAGIQAPIGEFSSNSMDEWEHNLRINLLGTVYSCKAALPYLTERGSGSIINFSGGGATSSRAHFSAYAVAKTGIVRFTEILAEELRDRKIRVNAIAPGAVNTRMLKEVLLLGSQAGDKELREAKKRAMEGGVPPTLAADLVVFLASKRSMGLTGKLISAVWDPWKTWDKAAIEQIMAGDKYNLRRVS
jgi:3-oxoacyl-[acyl-carrier protein] reductase